MRIFSKLILIILLLSPRLLFAEPKHLTILHFNDLHGHLETKCHKGKCKGGGARIAYLIKEIEEENRNKGWDTLVLFGGDAFSGTLLSSKFRGEAEIAFFNAIAVDAMVLGNHDFDFGISILKDRSEQANFPMLSANTYLKGTKDLFARPTYIDNLSDLIVGIVGLTTERTPVQTNPKNVTDLTFRNVITAAKNYLRYLRGTDFKIALTHMGVKKDVNLAKKVRGFNVIIGGHDHVRPNEYCRTANKIPVCQTPANGRYVGRLDFKIDGRKINLLNSELIPITDKIKRDQKVAALIEKYEKPVQKEYKRVIGKSLVTLKRARGHESALGNLVADVIRETAQTQIAFMNDGGIRADIYKGPISYGEIAEVLPFDNYIVRLKLTGGEVQELLNHSVTKGNNAFLEVSGLSFKIQDGNAVNVRIGEELINPKKVYTAATVDFLATGGDGYAMLKNKEQDYTGVLIRDAMVAYIKGKKEIENPPSGRISY